MQWTSSICLFSKKAQREQDIRAMLYSAADVLARDIRGAQRVYTHGTSFIVRHAAGCIGWELDKGKLVRSYGEYDMTRKVWRTRKKGVIALGVDTLSLVNNGAITHCILEVAAPVACHVEQWVASRCGEIS